jgi:hypothetical protein
VLGVSPCHSLIAAPARSLCRDREVRNEALTGVCDLSDEPTDDERTVVLSSPFHFSSQVWTVSTAYRPPCPPIPCPIVVVSCDQWSDDGHGGERETSAPLIDASLIICLLPPPNQTSLRVRLQLFLYAIETHTARLSLTINQTRGFGDTVPCLDCVPVILLECTEQSSSVGRVV